MSWCWEKLSEIAFAVTQSSPNADRRSRPIGNPLIDAGRQEAEIGH